jgi:hypothetical protein
MISAFEGEHSMYQAPLPASTTGCACPAGPHRSMTLIQRITWSPLYPANCQTCGAPLIRPRAVVFFVPVPAILFSFALLSLIFWPNLFDRFFDSLYLGVPAMLILQLLVAWFEFLYDPITVKPANKR